MDHFESISDVVQYIKNRNSTLLDVHSDRILTLEEAAEEFNFGIPRVHKSPNGDLMVQFKDDGVRNGVFVDASGNVFVHYINLIESHPYRVYLDMKVEEFRNLANSTRILASSDVLVSSHIRSIDWNSFWDIFGGRSNRFRTSKFAIVKSPEEADSVTIEVENTNLALHNRFSAPILKTHDGELFFIYYARVQEEIIKIVIS